MRILRWGWLRWFSLSVCALGTVLAGFFAGAISMVAVSSGPGMSGGTFLVLVGSLLWIAFCWRRVGRFIRYSRCIERWS